MKSLPTQVLRIGKLSGLNKQILCKNSLYLNCAVGWKLKLQSIKIK